MKHSLFSSDSWTHFHTFSNFFHILGDFSQIFKNFHAFLILFWIVVHVCLVEFFSEKFIWKRTATIQFLKKLGMFYHWSATVLLCSAPFSNDYEKVLNSQFFCTKFLKYLARIIWAPISTLTSPVQPPSALSLKNHSHPTDSFIFTVSFANLIRKCKIKKIENNES